MLQGRILTPDGWINGSIAFGQRITSITEGASEAGAGLTIIPGFVDLHVHGASGVDIMEGGDAGAVVARSHARHGTTALLGTTLTAKKTRSATPCKGWPASSRSARSTARACWACTWKARS